MLTQQHYQLLFLLGVLILFAIDLLKGLLWQFYINQQKLVLHNSGRLKYKVTHSFVLMDNQRSNYAHTPNSIYYRL